jgi:transcriptional regulator with XRE-family HTH domain
MAQRGVVVEVGERLTRFRRQAGLTVEAAAARTDVTADRLEQAESGLSALTEAELARLATEYGVDATEIFGGRVTPLQNYAGG